VLDVWSFEEQVELSQPADKSMVRHDDNAGRDAAWRGVKATSGQKATKETSTTYADASLATAGAILISKGTDDLIVGVCD
jgi:hypothetical protein